MQTTRTPANRHARPPAGPAGRALIAIATAALIALGVAGCDDEDEVLAVLPITADITIPGDLSADPLVYLERLAAVGDTVTVRVMLRTLTTYNIDAIDLDIRFDPALVQLLAQIDGAATPLGTCNDPASCAPTCLANTNNVNIKGELIVGISLIQGCPSVPVNTSGLPNDSIPILTLNFRAATVGTSPIEFVYDPSPSATGDCEILQVDPGPGLFIQHPIPCDDGGATLTATR